MPRTTVFISYARVDIARVREIVDIVRAAGYDPWFDHALLPGQHWKRELLRAIRACDLFLYALSPESVASEWCQWEFGKAVELRKPVVPVLLQRNTSLETPLSELQYADFCDGATGMAVARLTGGLRLAEIIAPDDAPPAPENPQGTPARATPTAPARLPFEPETVLVPAGPFLMGRDPKKHPDGDNDELPQHTVTLPDYRIGKYPVTVEEFRAFVEAGGYAERRFWTDAGWQWRDSKNKTEPYLWREEEWTGDGRLPVIGVSWYGAMAYVRWLSDVAGREYRLPTESEWERAARGTDGRLYPWGDAWRDGVCNTHEAGIGRTSPVGQFSPAGDSPYGAADMAGNVWEWCATQWRGDYSTAEDNALEGAPLRVLRGGAFTYNPDRARCVYRSGDPPYFRFNFFGFRVVCSRPPS
ncbi:MAG: SUMF1/EgtB/PvdO family nonheme iron enzyme [Anaerolineae bacterium]|nr:SUMF1/EgtB/PvdO family nonheme iron enzyme [Anaerolineae bacterium]